MTSENDATTPSRFSWDTGVGIGRLGAMGSQPDKVGTTYEYDGFGRESAETLTMGGWAYRLDFGYDAMGRLNKVTYPQVGGTRYSVDYEYSGMTGELRSVYDGTTGIRLWNVKERNLDRRVTSETFADSSTSKYVYENHRGLLKEEHFSSGTGANSLDLTFNYDRRGYLSTRSGFMTYHAGTNQSSMVNESFMHDELGRLTHWASASGDASGTWSVHYDYDDIGNIRGRDLKSADGSELKYSYTPGPSFGNWGGPHAITAVDLYTSDGQTGSNTPNVQTYNYDRAGRQVLASSAGGSRDIAFTDFDLPRRIDGTVTWDFLYDAKHQRVSKADSNGRSTVYVGKLYEKRTDESGVNHVMYVFGDGGRVVAQRTQPDGGGLATMDYVRNDQLGSVTRVLSSDGTSTEMRFDPFGARLAPNAPPRGATTPLPRMTLGFIGQEMEDDLGLVNLNGRLYDPTLMRFISADPIISRPLNSQGYNRYSYANNSPFRFADRSGYWAIDVLTYIFGGGGGGGGGSGSGSGDGFGQGGYTPGAGAHEEPAQECNGNCNGGNGGGGNGVGMSPAYGGGQQSVFSQSPAASQNGGDAFSSSFGSGGNVWGAPVIADGSVEGGSASQSNASASYAAGWAGPNWSARAEQEFASVQVEYQTQLSIGRPDAVLLPGVMPPVGIANPAHMMKMAFQHFRDPMWFANQVRTGAPWDFKNYGGRNAHPEWEDAGNFLYGFAGRAAGFPFDFLSTAAGFVHWFTKSSQPEFGSWLDKPFHGDGPDDQFWIEQGSRAFDLIQGLK